MCVCVLTTTTTTAAASSSTSTTYHLLCFVHSEEEGEEESLIVVLVFYCRRQSNKRPFVKAAENVLKAWWPSRQWFLPSLLVFMSSDCRSCKIVRKEKVPQKVKEEEDQRDELLFWTTDTKKSSVQRVFTLVTDEWEHICCFSVHPTSCLVRFDNIQFTERRHLHLLDFNFQFFFCVCECKIESVTRHSLCSWTLACHLIVI